ncbi:LOW QUALITY PROTEIN: hypothetical protein SORBI_3001G279800 [Sorghum bicolor]|uniref:Uncharacterized protein n=1 Tax=Sorghum bicolor TaxID=4558 RepID=A0A1B6QLI2_SORBI|nr:LOW QUALITY PROTEIN: hypothetical protein SORBI_3001G279800 [Sorghum bicolor]
MAKVLRLRWTMTWLLVPAAAAILLSQYAWADLYRGLWKNPTHPQGKRTPLIFALAPPLSICEHDEARPAAAVRGGGLVVPGYATNELNTRLTELYRPSSPYGGTLAHRFLLRRPLPWRRRFVRRFVPVAAPWGGVVLGMMTLVAGNNLGLPFVDQVALRGEYRSLQSSLWPLPNTNAFGAGQALVTTRRRTRTAHDAADFLDDIGMGAAIGRAAAVPGAAISEGARGLRRRGWGGHAGDARLPGRRLRRDAERMVMGDGDGLVNLASLLAVDPAWRRPAAYFRMLKVRNVSHTGLFVDDAALAVIISAILHSN